MLNHPVCVLIIWAQAGVGGETACAVYWGSALDASPACSAFPHNKAALKGQTVSWLCIGTQSGLRGEEGGAAEGTDVFPPYFFSDLI